jgi:hypothetical protein
VTSEPLWQQYERSVHQILSRLDPAATILHNQRLQGRLSGAKRQVDVWASGYVASAEVNIAIECKRYRRPVDVGTVDEFAGKLQDLNADRGILYSYSGFTPSAVNRAALSLPPKIQVIELESPAPGESHEPYDGPSMSMADGIASTDLWYSAPFPEDLSSEQIARFLQFGEWIAG